MKKYNSIIIFFLLLMLTACSENNEVKTPHNEQKEVNDKSVSEITYQPADGIIKIYGAGGPEPAIIEAANEFQKITGVKVDVVFGPEAKWTENAQRDADIIWGTAEQAMTAFLETYTEFHSDKVEPVYLRPAVIAVKKGNPKNIKSIDDLFEPNIGIVVVEGAGVYNTSGTGVWEDIVGRKGKLDDLKKFRNNIIAFAKGSGAGFKAFKQPNADAWITWNYWVIDHPKEADIVEIDKDRIIYRDLTLVTNEKADPEAKEFIKFMKSEDGWKYFKKHGWIK